MLHTVLPLPKLQNAAAACSEELVKSRHQTDKGREENDAASKVKEHIINAYTFLGYLFYMTNLLSCPRYFLLVRPLHCFTLNYSQGTPLCCSGKEQGKECDEHRAVLLEGHPLHFPHTDTSVTSVDYPPHLPPLNHQLHLSPLQTPTGVQEQLPRTRLTAQGPRSRNLPSRSRARSRCTWLSSTCRAQG